MMKKMWKNRSGVSPVIATILMVAITVVLAAVLYVMVMGFGGSSSAPTAAMSASHVSGNDIDEKIVVTSISSAQDFANVKVSMVIAGTSYSATLAANMTATMKAGATPLLTGYAISFVDLAGDGKVSTGDYFMVWAPSSDVGDQITMNLLYGSDSTSIASASWTVA